MNLKLAAAIVFAAGLSGSIIADDIDLDKPQAWQGKAPFVGDIIVAKGRVRLTGAKAFTIDPAKTYQLSFKLRKGAGAPDSYCYFGFFACDDKGAVLSPRWVNAVYKADGKLAAPVAKADTTIKIKCDQAWPKPQNYHTIAFDTKLDRSDLPNRAVAGGYVKSAKLANGVLELTMTRPVGFDRPAGTQVRMHGDGGYIYTTILNGKLPTEWKEFKGTPVGGKSLKWWPGAKTARALVFANWDNKPGSLVEIEDIEIDVK